MMIPPFLFESIFAGWNYRGKPTILQNFNSGLFFDNAGIGFRAHAPGI